MESPTQLNAISRLILAAYTKNLKVRELSATRPFHPERRTCFLLAGSVRGVQTLWEVSRLWPAGQGDTADPRIDLVELVALLWYILRLGIGVIWMRARRRCGSVVRWDARIKKGGARVRMRRQLRPRRAVPNGGGH